LGACNCANSQHGGFAPIAWIAAIIAAAAGGISAAQQKKAAKKGTAGAGINLEAAYGAAKKEFAPYSGTGQAALTRLAQLQGLKGYDVPTDVALREHLANKPVLGAARKVGASDVEKITGASPGIRVLSALSGGKGVGLVGAYGKSKKKRRAQQAELAAAQEAQHQEALKAWEAKTAELTAARDAERKAYEAQTPEEILKSTPGYQFRYQTGLGAVGSNQAARNATLGGRALKELTQYGQDFGSGEYQNEVNRLSQLAGMGERSATALGNLSVGQGTGLAGLNMSNANADVGYYGDLNNVVQSSLGNYLAYQQRQQKPTTQKQKPTTQSPYASSYDRNSPTTNPGYRPGQTLAPEDYN